MALFRKNLSDKQEENFNIPDSAVEVESQKSSEIKEQKIEQPEQTEKAMGEKRAGPEKEGISPPVLLGQKDTSTPAPSPVAKSARLKQIETVMQADLADLYLSMNKRQQTIFKTAGESTARQIESILTIGKSVFQKIFSALKKWLQLIPAVNRFFIEQEAKIKTDKIIANNSPKNES